MIGPSELVLVSRQEDVSIVKSSRSQRLCLFAARILLAFFLTCSVCSAQTTKKPQQVGEIAPDFELKSLKGTNVTLSEITKKKKVVLIVLRGFPGYQCPVCNKQVGQFLGEADKFKSAGADGDPQRIGESTINCHLNSIDKIAKDRRSIAEVSGLSQAEAAFRYCYFKLNALSSIRIHPAN